MANQGGHVQWSRTNENGRTVIQIGGDFTTEELTDLFRNIVSVTKSDDIDQPVSIEYHGPVPYRVNSKTTKTKAKKEK